MGPPPGRSSPHLPEGGSHSRTPGSRTDRSGERRAPGTGTGLALAAEGGGGDGRGRRPGPSRLAVVGRRAAHRRHPDHADLARPIGEQPGRGQSLDRRGGPSGRRRRQPWLRDRPRCARRRPRGTLRRAWLHGWSGRWGHGRPRRWFRHRRLTIFGRGSTGDGRTGNEPAPGAGRGQRDGRGVQGGQRCARRPGGGGGTVLDAVRCRRSHVRVERRSPVRTRSHHGGTVGRRAVSRASEPVLADGDGGDVGLLPRARPGRQRGGLRLSL
jgi:hypothetical protein